MPLPRGYIITDPGLMFFGRPNVVAVLGGWGGGPAPAMLQINLHRKKIWFYPPESPILMENIVGGALSETDGQDLPREPRDRWFECSTLADCGAERDYCGNWVAIRRDSVEAFKAWTRATVSECGPPLLLKPDEKPTLLCAEARCTLRWVEEEQSRENLP